MLLHLRFQGPPFIPPLQGALCLPQQPQGQERPVGRKEGAETVAPTHGKVLLNVIFHEFTDILAEFLLGRKCAVCTPASLLRSVLPTVASHASR